MIFSGDLECIEVILRCCGMYLILIGYVVVVFEVIIYVLL